MNEPSRPIGLAQGFALFALVCGVASAFGYWLQRESLWEDEIIAITHGLQPFPGFFIEVLRNDIHPPFYFLLLKLWASINGDSDKWALASSMVSALGSAAVIGWVTRRVYGPKAALWAIALYCVLPTFAWSSGNLRMYGLVPALAVACWYVNREFLRTGRRELLGAIVVFQFLHAYTHAIGFYFAAFFALAALVEQWKVLDAKRLRLWALVQIASVASMLPVVASALLRGTEPLSASTVASLATYPARLLTAGQISSVPVLLWIGGAVIALYAIWGLTKRDARVMVLVAPLGALLTSVVVSGFGKPMFKPPVFAANLVPFLAIGAAAGIAASSSRTMRATACGFALCMGLGTWSWAQAGRLPENYGAAGRFLSSQVMAGDVVVVPTPVVFWGIARYAARGDWGFPLEVFPRESNAAWTKLKAKLGPEWTARLGLNPKADYVDDREVRYVIGATARDHTRSVERVWIVHRRGYFEAVEVGVPLMMDEPHWFGGEIAVTLGRSNKSGVFVVGNPPDP